MARFYGVIGFVETKQTVPGVWSEEIVERRYSGDINRATRRFQTADKLTDDINVSNEISILGDPYAHSNIFSMRYVEFMGAKWKISNVEVQYPRLILSVGGLYNG